MRRVTSSPSVSRGKTHAREPEVEELARLWLGHTAEQPAARVCARAPRPGTPCPTEPTGWGGGGEAGREQDGADGLLARTLYDTDLRRDKLTWLHRGRRLSNAV